MVIYMVKCTWTRKMGTITITMTDYFKDGLGGRNGTIKFETGTLVIINKYLDAAL